MKRLSVIIPAYNEEKAIGICLQSLKKQTSKNFEILVINNNSRDKTVKVARRFTKYVYNCPIQGFVPTRNFGARKAKTDFIAFLDADGYADKRWIESIIKTFDKDNSLAVVTGKDFFIEKKLFRRILYNLVAEIYNISVWFLNLMKKYDLTANNMAIQRKTFLELGGFDNFICEDKWFSVKLRKHNYRCKFNRNMKVYYSSRRFQKNGYFKTIFLWIKATFIKIPLNKY